MKTRAKFRGFLALASATNGRKRLEFVNRHFNTAINIRRCAVPGKRRAELTRANFIGQTLKVAFYRKKLKQVVDGRSKKTAGRLHVGG